MEEVDEQAQGFVNYTGRLLNHVEMVYRPGERKLVSKLFTALGCQVIDSGATHLYIAVAEPKKYGSITPGRHPRSPASSGRWRSNSKRRCRPNRCWLPPTPVTTTSFAAIRN